MHPMIGGAVFQQFLKVKGGTEVHEVSDFEHDWHAKSDGRTNRVYFSNLDIWTRIIAKIPLFETKPL